MENDNGVASVCDGCGKVWVNVFGDNGVCMECVQARARVAFSGRCQCGRKAKPGEVLGGKVVMRIGGREIRGRAWIPCKRCLGVIKQVS